MISLVYSHKAGSVHCIITLDRYNNKIGPVSHFRQTRTLNAEHTFQVTLGVMIRNSVTRGKKSSSAFKSLEARSPVSDPGTCL